MEIKYICTIWGQDHLPIADFVAKAMESGFDGIELNVPLEEQYISSLQNATHKHGTVFIGQQWLPPAKETVDQYRNRLSVLLKHLVALNPIFINSHTGKDYFTFDDNCSIIEDCMAVTEQTGMKIIHETHRGRFAYHAHTLLSYIQKYNDLEFTADFSHLCTVSESMLMDQEDILETIIPRCSYIHARIGFDQAAQVNHPFAPEWEPTLQCFVTWWKKIVDNARQRGEGTFYICPEFGPAPYMPALPFTQQPVSSQWDINLQMMQYLKQHLDG